MLEKNLKWQDPLQTAYMVSIDTKYKSDWVFLYSGLGDIISDSISYLALYPEQKIVSNDFKEFDRRVSEKKWFGYLGYDLKNSLEKLSYDNKYFMDLPNLWMTSFNLVIKFHHKKNYITCYYKNKFYLGKLPDDLYKVIRKELCFDTKNLGSNFGKMEYISKVEEIKKRITNGDIYQANLTRKFYGELESNIDNNFDFFVNLVKLNKSNYSAFIKNDDNYIISSSPELFISIDKEGNSISTPIKGTAPRDSNTKQDIVNKNNLLNSSKETAENLMIVDLVRNDLSRNCIIGSVKVDELFKVSSYSNVHHMSSKIIGKKDKKYSNLDLIKSCFPPGSMTGAPKIKAMEICSELEQYKRGVYSGAIGLISSEECNLSVVIRTLIIKNNKFEFQIGGAITFDSDPEKEWNEIVSKAKTITTILGINLIDFN